MIIDMSEPIDQIAEKLTYWWSFIDNHSQRTSAPPHVILVASHSDVVKARGENVQDVMKQILGILEGIPATFTFAGSVYLDCRKLASCGLSSLLSILNEAFVALRSNTAVDFRCHVLSAYLTKTFPDQVACTVATIISCTKGRDFLLPQNATEMAQLLSTLNNKGQILLLKDRVNIEDSWVVLQRDVVLREVNGSIFSPEPFKPQCKDFTGSTGVVPLSKIKEKLPHHHPDMITGFLSQLDFCFKIEDYRAVEKITDNCTPRSPTAIGEEEEVYYFFPALVQVEDPPLDEVWKPNPKMTFQCGWFYHCDSPHQFLTTRCLHMLILRLAFSFALHTETVLSANCLNITAAAPFGNMVLHGGTQMPRRWLLRWIHSTSG